MKVVIVGGVAGGASTAARLRRLDEDAEIILFERGAHISYANCGLPYYIGGTISERNALFVQTPQGFSSRFEIDVRTESEVLSVHRQSKAVEVKNQKTGETYWESYDKLVLSPGAEPVKPPIPGIEDSRIFTLRNVPDTDRIKDFVDKEHPQRAVVVGAGFIGLEMAENLHKRGIFVTVVEMADQVMTPLDYEMAALVHQHLKMHHVEFYLNDAVKAFHEDKRLDVILNSGRVLPADMVILSIGVRPESALAKEAGLKIGKTGGIAINGHMQTSDHHIYAVGDAVEFPNPIAGKPMIAYLAGPGNKQGRIAASHIAGRTVQPYKGTLSTAIAKVFDLTVASTGLSEKTLKRERIPYISSITHGASHAGYYPGAKPVSIKLCFSPEDGRILGAQAVGYIGVDKRIDMIAAVLGQKGSIYDLTEVEHAYAPPFSSAKDPVNMAGFVAENILNGLMKVVHWQAAQQLTDDDFLLDVRTKMETDQGIIKGATTIPLDELRLRLDELPKDKRIMIYCAVGLRGYLGCRILMQHGFKQVVNLTGGYNTFITATQKQSNEDIYESAFIGTDDIIYSTKPKE